MIISGKNMQQIAKIYGEQSKPVKMNKPGKAGQQAPDEVVLSSEAKELSQMLQAIKNLPEVRADKVQELAQRIAAGTYKVDSQALAQKVLEALTEPRR